MADSVRMRIGIQGARELELQVADADATRAAIEEAIDGDSAIVWVTDAKGNRYGLATDKVAFVQIEDGSDRGGVGFGA
jgi:Protein of unknown function (DUF3107)